MNRKNDRIGLLISIDDSEFDQLMNERIVARSEMVDEFRTFLDPEQALQFLREKDHRPVDAILLDVNMPRMDGFTFIERAHEEFGPNFAKMVVVMLTTSLSPADRARAEACQVIREFFNKPLEISHLMTIRDLLN